MRHYQPLKISSFFATKLLPDSYLKAFLFELPQNGSSAVVPGFLSEICTTFNKSTTVSETSSIKLTTNRWKEIFRRKENIYGNVKNSN